MFYPLTYLRVKIALTSGSMVRSDKSTNGVGVDDSLLEESVLKAELAAISSVFPSHFIIYSSSGLSKFQVRQAPDAMSRPVIGVTSNNSSLRQPEPANPPVHDPTTSVIFTTGLITSLLIVFFILLPVLIVGVSALAGIQTPTRMEAPKGFNAVEKKNQ